MMTDAIQLLLFTAASIGFLHTLMGPDHYVPFIAMSKSGNWSLPKTLWITTLSGLGHVAGSVILGFLGIAFGVAIGHLEWIESIRGELAAWTLIIFGLLYMAWGIRQVMHSHIHDHSHEDSPKRSMIKWILFTIFVLGPCEPLIPILMYPAMTESWVGVVLVVGVFGVTTILTMLVMVFISVKGLSLISMNGLEKYTHALAGFTVFLSGAAIQFLGL